VFFGKKEGLSPLGVNVETPKIVTQKVFFFKSEALVWMNEKFFGKKETSIL